MLLKQLQPLSVNPLRTVTDSYNVTHHRSDLSRACGINLRGKRHHHGADEFGRDARRFVKGRPSDFERGSYEVSGKKRPLVGIFESEIQLHSGRIGRRGLGGDPSRVVKTVRGGCMVAGYTWTVFVSLG